MNPALPDYGTDTELAAQVLTAMDGPRSLAVNIVWPAKILWPNGRGHWAVKAKAVKKARQWAQVAAREALQAQGWPTVVTQPIPIKLIVYAMYKGPLPDRDGCISACKSALDGIADIIGINDRHFAAPTVEFATPRDGRIVVEIGG